MERQILHVDVNNAFLSWSAVYMLKNGYNIDIRTIPSIIGGDEERRSGIVLAKSPIAKKFGISTGEPIFFAKQKKFDYPTSNTKDIIKLSKQILKEMYNNELIRLVGVRVDNLENKEVQQLSLFDMKDEKQDKLDKAIDILKEKYGFKKIKRASDLFIDKSGKE